MKQLKKLKIILSIGLFLLTIINVNAQNAGFKCMKFFDEAIAFVAGDSGIVKQTIDGGISWTVKSSGTSNNLKITASLYNENVLVAGSEGTIIESSDYGDTWFTLSSGTSRDLYGMSFGGRSSETGIAVGDNSTILRTTDLGESWTMISNPDSTMTKPRLTSVSFASENNGITVGENGIILLTSDGGLDWLRCPSFVPNVDFKYVLMLSEDVAFVTGEGGIVIYSMDGGSSWESSNTNINSTLYQLDFADDQIAFSVGNGGGLIKTTNQGATWSSETSGTTNNLNCVFVIDENTTYAAGDNGVILITTDGGTSWSSQSGGNKSKTIHGNTTIGSVKKTEDIILYPNYPNPSNPATTIKYYVPSAAQVTIKIYDSAGREVKTLVSGFLNSGTYSNIFDGSNLSSGMYYCRLIATSDGVAISQTMKIVLVK